MESLVYIPLLLVAILPAFFGMVQYNLLIALRNRVRESWGAIDDELKRRYGLVPRLIEVARAFLGHEHDAFTRLMDVRDRCAANHGPISSQSQDERALVAALQDFLARAAACPGLEADPRFGELHAELVETENRIQAARRSFDGHVRAYQKKCGAFPGSLIARMFGFSPMAFFAVESALRETPAALP